MRSTEIKIGDTVTYKGLHVLHSIDPTNLKVEAVIPSADMIVASGTTELGVVKCLMSGTSYFSLNKKSEAEKLQDLLKEVGNDAFCKIMAETIEKHNGLHQTTIRNLEALLSSSLIAGETAAYISHVVLSITSKLDK